TTRAGAKSSRASLRQGMLSAGEKVGHGLLALLGGEHDLVGHAIAVAVAYGHLDIPERRALEGREELGLQRPGVGEQPLDHGLVLFLLPTEPPHRLGHQEEASHWLQKAVTQTDNELSSGPSRWYRSAGRRGG